MMNVDGETDFGKLGGWRAFMPCSQDLRKPMILSDRPMRMREGMTSPLPHSTFRELSCWVFGLLWLPFLWLTLFGLTMGLGWAKSADEKIEIFKFVIAGNAFFLVSIIAFRKMVNPAMLLFWGMILNAMFGYYWMPSLKSWSHGGWMMAAPGLVLMALWVWLILVTIRDEHTVQAKS